MKCQDITQLPIALEIMQTREKSHLRQDLFKCIYSLFQPGFLEWIINQFQHRSKHRDKLWEDAKDAFQNGLEAFFQKSQKEGFCIKGSLKTTIYSFGFFQLLAFFKKDKVVYGANEQLKWFDILFQDDLQQKDWQINLDERETHLLDALANLPKKQRDILIMKFFQKLKSKQIAEMLGVSVGNVDNDSTKAYKELRNILKQKSAKTDVTK